MLSGGEDGEHCVLDGVELVCETLNQGLVQHEQVRVVSHVEGLVLEVDDQFVTDLMPQSRDENKTKTWLVTLRMSGVTLLP